ncbi:MAG: DUF1211 domain-containing protein [Nitriliruptor sp.]|nr:MAG: DUF1211 domain-containing protein [Nitriliruptor sp.]
MGDYQHAEPTVGASPRSSRSLAACGARDANLRGGGQVTTPDIPSSAEVGQRHGRDTQEFTRLVNLSDAVFAIAMTLLVLTVDVPDVPVAELASSLLADLPQIGAYALAFALVASQWYAHHKLFQRLAFTEPGLTFVNLVLLGLVALVPFPTSVLSAHPTATAAVVPFLALFVVLTLAYITMLARAQAVGAWTEPLPTAVYRRTITAFGIGAATLLVGIAIAFWLPLLALLVAVLQSVPVILVLHRSPAPYRYWF